MRNAQGFIFTTLFTFIFLMMFLIAANVFFTLDRMNHFNVDVSLIVQRNGGVNSKAMTDIKALQNANGKYRQFVVIPLDKNGHQVSSNNADYGERVNYMISTKLMYSMYMPLKTVSKNYSITSNVRSNSL
ncbi:hypothetical protein SY212_19860 [Ligilactobacillus agilis]|uniref:Uncharacterized protein n=1 Tax=Ligilactobacillus agilis TaxID=1601 RepID=A0A6F9XNX3_9LACO|nr:hypothetical protein [Ligilactobacillus agilis]GET06956.1 hypothetical protein SY212_19860 [Ligilactobacillus agilis]